MSYNYQNEKKRVCSAEGLPTLLKVLENCKRSFVQSGCIRAMEAWKDIPCGDTFLSSACLDYLCEQKEIREVTPAGTWGQYRIFVSGKGDS